MQAAPSTWDIARALSHGEVSCGFSGVNVRSMIVRRRNRNSAPPKPIPLDGMIATFYTAATIPIGFFLIVCSFRPDWIKYLTDLHLGLAAAGFASLYLASKSLVAD